jgi:chromosome condensin MukBEF complex kleisin-like MukF subunit
MKTQTQNMKESDFQIKMRKTIAENEAAGLEVRLTDNRRAVVVEIGEINAAYTADEARSLAQAIEQAADQRSWERNVTAMVEYIRDLADVVDSPDKLQEKMAEEVVEKWENNDDIHLKNE